MHSTSYVKSPAKRWKSILGVLVAVVLLLPLPAFAAISFTGNTWTTSGSLTNGSLTINNSSDLDTLVLTLGAGELDGTISFVSTGITGTGTLDGTITGLTGNNLTSGTFSITVTTSNPVASGVLFDNTSNMFNSGANQPSNQDLDARAVNASPTITVTFTFTDAVFNTQPSSPWTTFQFTGT